MAKGDATSPLTTRKALGSSTTAEYTPYPMNSLISRTLTSPEMSLRQSPTCTDEAVTNLYTESMPHFEEKIRWSGVSLMSLAEFELMICKKVVGSIFLE
jgi:hypothetical protein